MTPFQSNSIEKGTVIPKVQCQESPNYSYAVYLPRKYDASIKWPIVYCFDPAARGSVPVELFKAAAEEYGYIVIGSNDSHNGPGVSLDSIVKAVWTDTHARFSIDEKRVYSAGFSGGARVAIAFAFWKPADAAGVIACSGGLPTDRTTAEGVPFAVFATAGNEDFNFAEMFNLTQELDSIGSANDFETFQGDHDWAPASLCGEGLEWMEAQAMRSGRRVKDASLIARLEQKRAAQAEEDETNGRLYDAWRHYKSLATNFAGLADVSRFQAKAAALKDAKEVKASVKQIREQILQQRAIQSKLDHLKSVAIEGEQGDSSSGNNRPSSTSDLGNLGGDDQPQSPFAGAAALRREISELQTRASKVVRKGDESEKLAAARALGGFFVECFELAVVLKSNRRYGLAAANLEIAAYIKPKAAGIQYSLARVYCAEGKKDKALQALGKAIDNGWKDRSAIESDEELGPLRGEKKYSELLQRLDSASKP